MWAGRVMRGGSCLGVFGCVVYGLDTALRGNWVVTLVVVLVVLYIINRTVDPTPEPEPQLEGQ